MLLSVSCHLARFVSMVFVHLTTGLYVRSSWPHCSCSFRLDSACLQQSLNETRDSQLYWSLDWTGPPWVKLLQCVQGHRPAKRWTSTSNPWMNHTGFYWELLQSHQGLQTLVHPCPVSELQWTNLCWQACCGGIIFSCSKNTFKGTLYCTLKRMFSVIKYFFEESRQKLY